MANHASAEKRNRQRITRTERNRAAKSALRTIVKRARAAAETGGDNAADLVKAAERGDARRERQRQGGVLSHGTSASQRGCQPRVANFVGFFGAWGATAAPHLRRRAQKQSGVLLTRAAAS